MATIKYEGDEVDYFEKLGEQLPRPVGYKMLIALPKTKEMTDGGIVLPDERRNAESVASIIGLVIAMGDDCYKDKSRYNSPWCELGDWVVIRSYSGTRFKVNDTEFRIINEDSIDAVVADPRGISRV